jgi:hypothetical protein
VQGAACAELDEALEPVRVCPCRADAPEMRVDADAVGALLPVCHMARLPLLWDAGDDVIVIVQACLLT